MSVLTTFAGTGSAGYAPGDNLRAVTTTVTTTETTVLNVTSTKGILLGIQFYYTRSTGVGTTNIDALKYTADGAAERTLLTATPFIRFSYSATNQDDSCSYYLPLNLPFDSSLVVKTRSDAENVRAVVFYGIRN